MSLSSETSEAIAMTKVIVYTLPNGSTCVCHPCVSRDDPSGFTAEDALARALIKDIPADAISVRVVERSALPSDRSFGGSATRPLALISRQRATFTSLVFGVSATQSLHRPTASLPARQNAETWWSRRS
jgi:hypothetical protein